MTGQTDGPGQTMTGETSCTDSDHDWQEVTDNMPGKKKDEDKQRDGEVQATAPSPGDANREPTAPDEAQGVRGGDEDPPR